MTRPADADVGSAAAVGGSPATLYRTSINLASPHARERALERYGVEMDEAAAAEAVMSITDALIGAPGCQASRMDGHPCDNTEVWLVRVSGVLMRLVYNPANCSILTVLPIGARRSA